MPVFESKNDERLNFDYYCLFVHPDRVKGLRDYNDFWWFSEGYYADKPKQLSELDLEALIRDLPVGIFSTPSSRWARDFIIKIMYSLERGESIEPEKHTELFSFTKSVLNYQNERKLFEKVLVSLGGRSRKTLYSKKLILFIMTAMQHRVCQHCDRPDMKLPTYV